MQVLKCVGCAGVATGSILVYAYILIYCFKELGFENEGFEVEIFLFLATELTPVPALPWRSQVQAEDTERAGLGIAEGRYCVFGKALFFKASISPGIALIHRLLYVTFPNPA